jgi:lipopolysaccharide transport system permease protein
MLKTILKYRQFIFSCVKREFQARYQKSLLGSAWAVLNPLAMITVYTVIFSQVMKAKLPGIDNTFGYSIFLCAGTLTWGLFAEIVNRSTAVFIENANLLKKLAFPRICLPMIIVLSAIGNFIISFSLFLLFLTVTGNFPGIPILAVIPLLIIQVIFSVGLGVLLGVLNVFFRDVGQLIGILLQFWFWMTPIVYPVTILPNWIASVIALNPMTQIIRGYQTIFVSHEWPIFNGAILVAAFAFLLCGYALKMYRDHVGEMVDEL